MASIGFIGVGKLGQACAEMVAEVHDVVGYDINPVEPENFTMVDNMEDAVKGQDIVFIAVPTPIIKSTKGNPKPDISYVLNAAKSIAKIIKKNDLVIIESTCPVGTTNKVSKVISDYGNISIKEFHIAYCPERVLPGNIIDEIKNNNRVIGGTSEEANKEAIRFFSTFCHGDLVKTDSKTAEYIKYMNIKITIYIFEFFIEMYVTTNIFYIIYFINDK